MAQSKKVAGGDSKTSSDGAPDAQKPGEGLMSIASMVLIGLGMLIVAGIMFLCHIRDVGLVKRTAGQNSPKPAEEPAKPTDEPIYSRFRGKTLRRSKDEWIKVEDDGVTFTCPTQMGNDVRPRPYTMPNPTQIAFMDAVLLHFADKSTEGWYKPPVDKSVWQNKLFNRGDAAQFLKDKHLATWVRGQKGGKRGSIRLVVAKPV